MRSACSSAAGWRVVNRERHSASCLPSACPQLRSQFCTGRHWLLRQVAGAEATVHPPSHLQSTAMQGWFIIAQESSSSFWCSRCSRPGCQDCEWREGAGRRRHPLCCLPSQLTRKLHAAACAGAPATAQPSAHSAASALLSPALQCALPLAQVRAATATRTAAAATSFAWRRAPPAACGWQAAARLAAS